METSDFEYFESGSLLALFAKTEDITLDLKKFVCKADMRASKQQDIINDVKIKTVSIIRVINRFINASLSNFPCKNSSVARLSAKKKP